MYYFTLLIFAKITGVIKIISFYIRIYLLFYFNDQFLERVDTLYRIFFKKHTKWI